MKVVVLDVFNIVTIIGICCNAIAVVRESVPVITRHLIDVLIFLALVCGHVGSFASMGL